MKCRDVLSRLSAFLDGELPGEHRQGVEEHLRVCPSCRGRLEGLRNLSERLDRIVEVPPLPQGFAARVLAEAQRRLPAGAERRVSPSVRPGWLPSRWLADLSTSMRLAAAATVLLGLVAGWTMSRELSLSEVRRPGRAPTESLGGFEWFGPAPPDSLASAYLRLDSSSRQMRETP